MKEKLVLMTFGDSIFQPTFGNRFNIKEKFQKQEVSIRCGKLMERFMYLVDVQLQQLADLMIFIILTSQLPNGRNLPALMLLMAEVELDSKDHQMENLCTYHQDTPVDKLTMSTSSLLRKTPGPSLRIIQNQSKQDL